MPRDIDYIANLLKRNKDAGIGCALLTGAGCSVSAGIPLAGEFVDIIKNGYPTDFGKLVKAFDDLAQRKLNRSDLSSLSAKKYY